MGSKPKTQAYNTQASQNNQIWAADQARKYGNVGVNSALGGYNWTTNADGTQSVNVNLSDTDKQKQSLQNQALQNLSLDPTQAQDTYYNMSTRYMEPQQQQQQADLEQNLTNKGITIGSSAWNRATGELQDNQQQALAQARDNALGQGQQYISGNINNINSLGSSINNPLQSMVQGQGGQFGGQYDTQYAAQNAAAQQNAAAKNARTNAYVNAGTGLASGVLAAFSDRRLKENIEFIKELEGIKIYKFNYKPEAKIDNKKHIGVMAQEVLKTLYKNAIKKDKSGYYKVDYGRLPITVQYEINNLKEKENGK
jgi:hypothetical protein